MAFYGEKVAILSKGDESTTVFILYPLIHNCKTLLSDSCGSWTETIGM